MRDRHVSLFRTAGGKLEESDVGSQTPPWRGILGEADVHWPKQIEALNLNNEAYTSHVVLASWSIGHH